MSYIATLPLVTASLILDLLMVSEAW